MKFIVKESVTGGSGCFAIENVKKGEFITKFLGEEVSTDEINKRIASGSERLDDPLQIEKDLFIDINDSSYFFNHSCDPNAGIKGKNELYAIRDIKKDEEITYDYSATVSKDIDWQMKCSCNSKNCRKIIGNVLTIPKEKIREYKEAGVLQDFIKDQL